MDKVLNYLSLARKAGRAELGEEPAGAAARAGKAYLIAVAKDASDHTWRRAQSFVAGTDQQCVRVPYTKDQMGQSVGRSELALAAITDPAMALGFLKTLEPSNAYQAAMEVLARRTGRVRQRQSEAKVHQRNKRQGKPHREDAQKQS